MKQRWQSLRKKADERFGRMSDAFFRHTGWALPVMAVAILFLAVVARIGAFEHVSGDITYFLRPWYTRFYEEGFGALGENFGDYTPAYMLLLYLLSLFRFAPDSFGFLAGLKTVSLLFDVASAVALYMILRTLGRTREVSLIGGGVLLFLPTVFLNSSYWGQCDSIWCCFLLYSLYFALRRRDLLVWIFWGFSFSFKLQAVFFLPFLILLCLDRRLKCRYAPAAVLSSFVLYVPALVAGRSLGDVLSVYVGQTASSYQQLSLNAPSLYALFAKVFEEYPRLTLYAVAFCIFSVGALLALFYRKRVALSSAELVTVALLFAILVPFLLPRMHERYFFLADLLGCLYLFAAPRRRFVGALPVIASLFAYIPYLFPGKMEREEAVVFGALLLLAAVLLLLDEVRHLLRRTAEGKEQNGA